jgi:hypothetical protein
VITRILLGIVVACAVSLGASAQDVAPADAPATFEKHVAQLKADFARDHPERLDDVEWVKSYLIHLRTIDQYGRTLFPKAVQATRNDPAQKALNEKLLRLWKSMDHAHTAELKRLIAKWGWISKARFGAQTENDAWLIAQHADDDPAFQQQVLALMEPLVKKGEAELKAYAYLYDRVAMSFSDPSKQKLQRYGTQGRCKPEGGWEPFPIEDPEHLEERRKEAGMPTMAEYEKLVGGSCPKTTA